MQKGKGKDKKGKKAEKPKVRDLARAGGKELTEKEVAAASGGIASGGTANSILQRSPIAGQPCGGPRCQLLAQIEGHIFQNARARQVVANKLSVQP